MAPPASAWRWAASNRPTAPRGFGTYRKDERNGPARNGIIRLQPLRDRTAIQREVLARIAVHRPHKNLIFLVFLGKPIEQLPLGIRGIVQEAIPPPLQLAEYPHSKKGDPFLQAYPVQVHIGYFQHSSIRRDHDPTVYQEPNKPIRRGRLTEGPLLLVSSKEDRGVPARSIIREIDTDLLGVGQLLLSGAVVAGAVHPLHLIGRQEAAALLNIIHGRRGFDHDINLFHPACLRIFTPYRIHGTGYTVSLGCNPPPDQAGALSKQL